MDSAPGRNYYTDQNNQWILALWVSWCQLPKAISGNELLLYGLGNKNECSPQFVHYLGKR